MELEPHHAHGLGRGIAAAFIVSVAFLFVAPLVTEAFPFGGKASVVLPCYNQVIYAALGAPNGGPYIWSPSTRTYLFGPPRHPGQWLLGLAGVPYFCIVILRPLTVWPGTHIMMMGSSGSGGSVFQQPQPTPAPAPSPGPKTNSYDAYCRTRTSEEWPAGWVVPTVDPCLQITENMTCEDVRAQGYKFIHRCGT